MEEKELTPKAPCRQACPAGIDVPRYVRLLGEGRFTEALAVIRQRLPLAGVCGFACVHPCEAKCSRLQLDEALAIRMLKRAAFERGRDKSPPRRLCPTGKTVAVVGSGPCGLSAAHFLGLLGHTVRVFEALPRPGGMLRYAIPAYRLPEEVLERDIAWVTQGGVAIETNARISSPSALREREFAAVVVATGAWRPLGLGIPGEGLPCVVEGLALLRQIREGKRPALGRRVVVVGGGNTAVDAARSALRLGAEVTILYRRSRQEMPALPQEVEAALAEGVRIEYLAQPLSIEPNKARCARMRLGQADNDGRRLPFVVSGSEFDLPFDTLVTAVGQEPDKGAAGIKESCEVGAEGIALAGEGVFAAGDVVSGPATIIEAVSRGRLAAAAVDRYLGGDGAIPEGTDEKLGHVPAPAPAPGVCRVRTRSIPLTARRASFAAVERPLGLAAVKNEARRCLSCDLRSFEVAVDGLLCKDCGYCAEVCGLEVFSRSAEFNPSGYRPAVASNAERCMGCLRCLYICPDFAITIREKAAL